MMEDNQIYEDILETGSLKGEPVSKMKRKAFTTGIIVGLLVAFLALLAGNFIARGVRVLMLNKNTSSSATSNEAEDDEVVTVDTNRKMMAIEDVIKQAVELGANKIVFFSSSNCIAEKREKGEKYAKTARQAAMQAGRDRIPEVVSGVTFAEMIDGLAAADISAFFHEKADLPLYDVILTKKDPRSAAFAVGPEGGFSDKEAEIAIQKGIPVVSLGKRILRAVTAPLCALSVLTSVYDR